MLKYNQMPKSGSLTVEPKDVFRQQWGMDDSDIDRLQEDGILIDKTTQGHVFYQEEELWNYYLRRKLRSLATKAAAVSLVGIMVATPLTEYLGCLNESEPNCDPQPHTHADGPQIITTSGTITPPSGNASYSPPVTI